MKSSKQLMGDKSKWVLREGGKSPGAGLEGRWGRNRRAEGPS